MTLADRLKQARGSLQLSQKEMGKKVSVSLQMWQAYEAGKSVPGGNVLEALARLGFNVNWVLTGVGPEKLNEADMKRFVCEEEHQKLRKRIRDRILKSKPLIVDIYSDIPGLPYDDVVAYANGEKQLTKDQLIEVCQKSGSPFFDDEFIKEVTSVDFMQEHEQAAPQGSIDSELLEAVIEAVEEYLEEVKGFLPSKKKAQLIVALYDLFFAKEERKVDKATVIQLVKLAA